MIEWNEHRLEELVRKMGLERMSGEKTPIHLSLYGTPGGSKPLLTKIMRLDASKWTALGYDETDRVSVVQYLSSLGCRTDGAWSVAVRNQQPLTLELAKALLDAGTFDKEALSYAACYQRPLPLDLAKLLIDAGAFNKDALQAAAESQQPLTLELAKLLIDAGAFNKSALRTAAEYQQPLTLELAKLLIDAGAFDKDALWRAARYQQPLALELAKLLIDAGCNPAEQEDGWCKGWDALVWLAVDDHPVDPQVTDLFLSAGCRRDLDGCRYIDDRCRSSFDQILKEHAQWKESLNRMSAENSPTDTSYGPDWGR